MFAVLQEVNTSNPRVWIPKARLIVAAMWCRVYFFSTAANGFFFYGGYHCRCCQHISTVILEPHAA